jgi:hypothetical protein
MAVLPAQRPGPGLQRSTVPRSPSSRIRVERGKHRTAHGRKAGPGKFFLRASRSTTKRRREGVSRVASLCPPPAPLHAALRRLGRLVGRPGCSLVIQRQHQRQRGDVDGSSTFQGDSKDKEHRRPLGPPVRRFLSCCSRALAGRVRGPGAARTEAAWSASSPAAEPEEALRPARRRGVAVATARRVRSRREEQLIGLELSSRLGNRRYTRRIDRWALHREMDGETEGPKQWTLPGPPPRRLRRRRLWRTDGDGRQEQHECEESIASSGWQAPRQSPWR